MADWIKWNAAKFLIGVRGLKANEGWTYTIILNLIYEHDGPIPYDPAIIAQFTGAYHVRDCEKAIAILIGRGKLYLIDGMLHNKKASQTLKMIPRSGGDRGEILVGSSTHSGDIVGGSPTHSPTILDPLPEDSLRIKNNKSNEIKEKPVLGVSREREDIDKRKDESRAEDDEARALWNSMAKQCGLKQINPLSDVRRKALRLRLGDLGGIDGWKTMLEKIQASAFLSGRKTDFAATFDWVLKPANLTKIMEGNYDGGARKQSDLMDAFDRLGEQVGVGGTDRSDDGGGKVRAFAIDEADPPY